MKYALISILCVCALPLHSQQVRYDDEPCPQSEARAVSEEFSKSTVYQIFLGQHQSQWILMKDAALDKDPQSIIFKVFIAVG